MTFSTVGIAEVKKLEKVIHAYGKNMRVFILKPS